MLKNNEYYEQSIQDAPNRLDNVVINELDAFKTHIKYYKFIDFPIAEIESKIDIFEDYIIIKEYVPKYFIAIVDAID